MALAQGPVPVQGGAVADIITGNSPKYFVD